MYVHYCSRSLLATIEIVFQQTNTIHTTICQTWLLHNCISIKNTHWTVWSQKVCKDYLNCQNARDFNARIRIRIRAYADTRVGKASVRQVSHGTLARSSTDAGRARVDLAPPVSAAAAAAGSCLALRILSSVPVCVRI